MAADEAQSVGGTSVFNSNITPVIGRCACIDCRHGAFESRVFDPEIAVDIMARQLLARLAGT